METINRTYHEEDPEYVEEVKQKQETTKKLLHSLLIQPELSNPGKSFMGLKFFRNS